MSTVKLTVNGKAVAVDVEDRTLLVHLLRDHLNLTGTHAAAAGALEQAYAARLEDAYDRLAYHYSKAEHADKAVDYLTRFAEKAAREHAHGLSLEKGSRPGRVASK